jgi:RNA polymerase sigma factor (sigma-70 family)
MMRKGRQRTGTRPPTHPATSGPDAAARDGGWRLVARESEVVVHGTAVDGDPMHRLFLENYGAMVRLAAMLGGRGGAEDAVQEAFLAVDAKAASIPPEALVPYLRRAVINATRSSARRSRALKRQVIPLRDYPPETEDGVLGDEQHRRVMAALDTLSSRQRQCLVLRYYAGLTDSEIAEQFGVAPGSVKTHLRRGLDALHAKLGDLR